MGGCVAQEVAADMIEKPDCERCQRIKSAIDQGLSPDAAREANGWDECWQDDCPMLPAPWRTVDLRGAL
jgi:hypothetical protein